MAERFSVGVRTLQKDFNERLAFLDWDLKGPRFYSLNRNQFGVFTKEDVERFARFASIQDLFPKLDRELFQRTLTDTIQVKGFQYESIQHRQGEFKQLQQTIKKLHLPIKNQGEPLLIVLLSLMCCSIKKAFGI